MTITEPAPAKINLALHIRRKRPDGYHDLETLFAFARDGDVVTLEVADEDSFTITGPFGSALAESAPTTSTPAKAGAQGRRTASEGPPLQAARNWGHAYAGAEDNAGVQQNLVVRAVEAFRANFDLPQPVAITLEKNLPVASGIGGGSADAAATLRALAHFHNIDPTGLPLLAISGQLGADVPACLLGRTAFATGRGDALEFLPPLGDLPLLLVNPGVPLSTAAMFAAWDGVDGGAIVRDAAPLDAARAGRNDFAAPAIAAAPAVADVMALLDRAPGCTFARLSGSGATCFGLFENIEHRDLAAVEARAKGWWALATLAT